MNEVLDNVADDIANEVLHHIDTMYPAMWNGVASSARLSLRNTIRAAVLHRIFATGEEPPTN